MMKIIPAIDIIGGKCVRLIKGDYAQQSIYEKTPVEMAKYFESAGADKIHVVDLDAALAQSLVNLDTIKSICQAVSIPVEVGGGIRSQEDIEKLFLLGVQQVVIGSLAVKNYELVQSFIREFGPERIIVGIDALNETPKISGWQEDTSISVDELMKLIISIGVKTINYTDISRDGTLSSPNFEAYKNLVKKYPQLNVVASGGVSSQEDVKKLREIGVTGVIIGKAIYEEKINLKQVC